MAINLMISPLRKSTIFLSLANAEVTKQEKIAKALENNEILSPEEFNLGNDCPGCGKFPCEVQKKLEKMNKMLQELQMSLMGQNLMDAQLKKATSKPAEDDVGFWKSELLKCSLARAKADGDRSAYDKILRQLGDAVLTVITHGHTDTFTATHERITALTRFMQMPRNLR